MPTAIIAEDETNLALALKDALARVWPELAIVDTVGNGPAALHAVDQHSPDVLFLDIRMPGLTGLQVAQRLTESGIAAANPLVVFVTAYSEYALQAFDREAVDYLVKPVDETRLAETVVRLKKQLAQRSTPTSSDLDKGGELTRALDLIQKLAGQSGERRSMSYLQFLRAGIGETVRIVPVDEVTHLHAQDKYVSIFTADGEQLIRISLTDLSAQLDPNVFVQVHRSTIVNMRSVETAARDFTGKVTLTLKGVKEKVQVSRQHAHLFARM
ncbi:MAG: DNA-binding response regulator [Betaproteobacteria bacterium]|nr:MAG: DNA-binding response regulator [Betaproteobacteria bacterium]